MTGAAAPEERTAPTSLAALPDRGGRAGYVLFLLFLANVLNVADRALLGIVVDPVKADLALSDTQISIVSATAFVFFNLLVGIFIAGWVDRGNRKWILILGVTLWSVATALSGMAQGFASLGLARILVGVGEATAFPVAISMIADLYDTQTRPRAISIFQSSVFVGVVLGSILAGVLAAAVGWRAMFLICGAVGLVLVAVMMPTLREPRRGRHDAVPDTPIAPAGIGTTVAALLQTPGFVALSLGAAFAAMATAVLPTWAPAFLLRSHGVALAAVGAIIGPAVGIGGISGTVVSGVLASRLVERSGHEGAALLVPLFALPLATPAFLLFILAPSLTMAMTGAAIMNFLLSSAIGPCMAAAIGIVPVRSRAMASTLIMIAIGILGGALAPFVVGTASDAMQPAFGIDSLRYGLATMAPMPLLGAVALLIAYRKMLAR